jgi:hypothetical protein
MTAEVKQLEINGRGSMTRADVLDILKTFDGKNNYIDMQLFLEGVTALTGDQKIMLLSDLESYV